jgi:hypothetical protein
MSLGKGLRRDLREAVKPLWGRMRRVWFVLQVWVKVEGDGEVERVVGLGVLASSVVVGEGEGCTVVVVARVCQEQRVKGWL